MLELKSWAGEQVGEGSPRSEDPRSTPRPLLLLFSYLYFVQGAVLGVVGAMPYVYPSLPDVPTMALFSLASLPYSLKFLLGTPPPTQPPSSRSSPVAATANARPGWWPASC
jgi:hypothetical protein